MEGATEFCWSKASELEPTDFDDATTFLNFLRYVPDQSKAKAEYERLVGHVFESGLVADVDATGYVFKPLDWAGTPDHPLRKHFRQEDVDAHLDAIETGQEPDGGRNITWESISPSCEMAWRGAVTLQNLMTLRANGRL